MEPITPEKVHELLALPAPFEPPPPPPPWKDCLTFWDSGVSIVSLRKTFRSLFCPTDWVEAHRWSRATDVRGWKQLRLAPLLPGKPFTDQEANLAKSDRLASAREIILPILAQFLATSERLLVAGRLRTRDQYDDGKRVCVGFGPFGFDLSYARDHESWPSLGLASVSVLVPKKKRK